jgi:hypothetical protein
MGADVDRAYCGHKHDGATKQFIPHSRGITSPSIKRDHGGATPSS